MKTKKQILNKIKKLKLLLKSSYDGVCREDADAWWELSGRIDALEWALKEVIKNGN